MLGTRFSVTPFAGSWCQYPMSGEGDDQCVKFAGSELNVRETETHLRGAQMGLRSNDKADASSGSLRNAARDFESYAGVADRHSRFAVATPIIWDVRRGGATLHTLERLVDNPNIAAT